MQSHSTPCCADLKLKHRTQVNCARSHSELMVEPANPFAEYIVFKSLMDVFLSRIYSLSSVSSVSSPVVNLNSTSVILILIH